MLDDTPNYTKRPATWPQHHELELEWSQGLESVGSEHLQTYNTLRTSFPPVAELFWVSGNAFADIRQVVMLLEPKRKKCEETYPKKKR